MRHGQTDWNVERRIQGQLNSQLTDYGREQARSLGARLRGEHFDRYYSSTSDRAKETAQLVFPEADVELDERLRELSYGVLEGKTYAEFSPEEREMRDWVSKDPFGRAVPKGETWNDLMLRVATWIGTLPKTGRVVAVTHGGTIRAAVYALTARPRAYEWNLSFGNTGVTRLRITDDSHIVLGLNDTAHLEPLNRVES